MENTNNKRIEETATTALKSALLRCPILDSYIDSNDKTPSWDGTVFVYKNEKQKKADLLGRVPIQVKGTKTIFCSDIATFSCGVADLRSYYYDGGCVLFLVSVSLSTGETNIFYTSLLVYDLKRILDGVGKQKTITIKLRRFPTDDINELATIFLSFTENFRKQMSFINQDMISLDQLVGKGIEIESVTFSASGLHLNHFNIYEFITTHDHYLYAKPKGLNIGIPVEKVKNVIVSRPVQGKVMVKNTEYYPAYSVMYENGKQKIRIGKGIGLILFETANKLTFSFNPAGTLDDFIKDAKCFIDAIENSEITLNGKRLRLPFSGTNNFDLDKYKISLQYYNDVKKMLDLLGVSEGLQCEELSRNDEDIIRKIVNTVLYNKRIELPGVDGSTIYGALKIANLSIWLWATRQENGYYRLESFFNPRQIAIFANDDTSRSKPVPASQFLLLNKEAFVHCSNMDYEIVRREICTMEHHPLLLDSVIFLMLNILQGYDSQDKKDLQLLDVCDGICDWLSEYNNEIDSQIVRLNRLQVIKRRRLLQTAEIIELGNLADADNPANIRCGAYLILGNITEAQKCFDGMPPNVQDEFITFPICNLGNLKKAEENDNG